MPAALHMGVPVNLPAASKHHTVQQPFSFDVRDADAALRKQERINKVLEEERRAREFHARPLPEMDRPVGLPIKEVLLPTQAK